MRIIQVKNLLDESAFRAHLESLGIELDLDAQVEPTGALATPVSFTDASAGAFTSPNRFAILPMEGWDGTTRGAPTDLVQRRWQRFADSGAGLVWAEATAVTHEGRANPNQLVLDQATVGEMAAMRSLFGPEQVVGLQLTHSGRYARPEGQPAPRTAYAHPVLDEPSGAGPGTVLSDDELDELVGRFIDAAVLAGEAGFDFVDVKACHGYLGHELLTAYDRPGRYGGDLVGRANFFTSIVRGIRAAAPQLAVALRLSVFDVVPHVPGEGGVGVPADAGPYRHAFGGDGSGLGIDLTETHALLALATELGVGLVCTTAGSPYYCPHVQRPAYFPPSDGYRPPEDPLVGVARQLSATAALTHAHPTITFIGSGYSYLQEWLAHVGQAAVASGDVDMVGIGRMALSYPHLPAHVLAGRPLDRRLVCRTFSDCTTAPRAGLVSGCFPLDPFYKQHPQRVALTQAKREASQRLR